MIHAQVAASSELIWLRSERETANVRLHNGLLTASKLLVREEQKEIAENGNENPFLESSVHAEI